MVTNSAMAGTWPTGVKLDDGQGAYATGCFPARGLVKHNNEGKYQVILGIKSALIPADVSHHFPGSAIIAH